MELGKKKSGFAWSCTERQFVSRVLQKRTHESEDAARQDPLEQPQTRWPLRRPQATQAEINTTGEIRSAYPSDAITVEGVRHLRSHRCPLHSQLRGAASYRAVWEWEEEVGPEGEDEEKDDKWLTFWWVLPPYYYLFLILLSDCKVILIWGKTHNSIRKVHG